MNASNGAERLEGGERLLKKSEAAARLGTSIRTVERLLQEGQLVKAKIRGSVRVLGSSVDALMRRACGKAGAA